MRRGARMANLRTREERRHKLALMLEAQARQAAKEAIARQRKVICIETGEVFDNCRAAAKRIGASINAVRQCLYRRATTKGLRLRRLVEVEAKESA